MSEGIITRDQYEGQLLDERLFNWKFRSAAEYVGGQPQEVKLLVKALAESFGNEGTPDVDENDKPGLLEDEISQREIVLLRAVVKHLIGDEGA